MKKSINIIHKMAVCFFVIVAMSCTGEFEEMNTNSQGVTDEELQQDFANLKAPMKVMFYNVIKMMPEWMYQIQQNLQGDIWSGYMASATPFASNKNNTTYYLMDGWNNQAWTVAYGSVMSNALKIKQRAKGKFDQVYAVSLILKVEAMHRVTDTYGPCVYSDYGSTETTVKYDSQADVYKKMFEELDFAVEDLTKRADANEETSIASMDFSTYGGNYTKWVKYANSLRLRLAMRLTKIDPALAEAEVKKALTHKFGVIVTNADSFIFQADSFHPIKTLVAWGDISMSADMESIMGGYADPRMDVYFTRVEKDTLDLKGTYKGVRTGIEIIAKSHRSYFSGIGKAVDTKNVVFMSASEVLFLKAEAALRSWDSGSAETFYKEGITLSFEQNGVGGAATYATSATAPKNYVDPVKVKDSKGDIIDNDIAAVSKVTVAWDEAATTEVKLEKIITQKWIALFPEGQEAWSEWRRTGYPKLFPVKKNDSDVIKTAEGVRRINFVQSEKDGNAGGVATGIEKLGGPDNGATRLWWDINKGNF